MVTTVELNILVHSFQSIAHDHQNNAIGYLGCAKYKSQILQ